MNERATILVVEDQRNIRRFIRRVLQDHPYDLIEAESGEAALPIINDDRYSIDLVLLDLVMPGMDGFQVLERLRSLPNREAVKVIVLTSLTEVEDRVRAFSAGANEYVTKPVSREELIARIEVQVRLKQAEAAMREREERYRDLFENANDLIQSVNPDGTVLYVNTAWLKTLGYSETELPELTVFDVVHPQVRAEYEEVFRKVLAGEQLGIVETRFVAKDGTIVEVEGKINCSFQDGKPAATRGIFRDVTERKRAEETIRKQAADLGERLKELHCLYSVSRLAEKPGTSIGELVQSTLTLIPYAWRYPEITCAHAIVEGEEFKTADFEDTAWKQSADITVDGRRVGVLEICYHRAAPEQDEGPFTKEERELIDAIAEELGRFIARRRAEDAIRQLNEELEQRVIERTAELREANQQLKEEIAQRRQAEQLFENLANNAPLGIYGVSEGRMQFANPQFQEYVGYQLEELTAMNPLSLVVPEDRDSVREIAQARLREGNTVPYEYRLVRKGGDIIAVMESVTSIRYMGKLMTLGYLMDISDRKEAQRKIEEQYRDIEERSQELETANIELRQTQARLLDANRKLKESEQKYRTVVEQANDWICIVQAGVLKYVNPHSMEVVGHTTQEMIGKPLADYIHPDNAAAFTDRENRRLGGEHVPARYEAVLLHRDGHGVDVEINARQIPYEGDEATLVIIRDITERKQTERERERLLAALQVQNEVTIAANMRLEEALEQVQKAQEDLQNSHAQLLQSEKLAAVGQLISGVAHELNNPLQAISGYTELMLMYVENPTVRQDLANLLGDTKRAIAIVRNLLSFARKQESQRKYISVNDAVESVIKLRAYELTLDNINLKAELDPALPKTMADYQQLQQVFLNLVINAEQAIKSAHGHGTIEIRTRLKDDMIQVTIRDDGPGIPSHIVGRIFEPFFTTKDVGKGTGLGLSICYGIINDHGGNIAVETGQGEGTTFTINFPVVTGAVKYSIQALPEE